MRRIVVLLALVAACAHSSACGTVKPLPTPGPTCVGDVACTCADVCAHGTALGCAWAEPTPAGYTCLDVCANATDPGGVIRWGLNCRAHSATCDESACEP